MIVKLSNVKMATEHGSNVVRLQISGKLTTKDYELFGPKMARLIQEHGKIRVLLDMDDFHGWTAGALWEDVKFDLNHFKDIERIAMIGDKAWEHGMATFCRPFTAARIRYFHRSKADNAAQWIVEG